ncbi:glycine cleavage system protein GcvH [Candidatus Venteria ishoeyi]|uniref:Glycine cleavage system H protein n=1 Tax=Candidatus Venteria ishoeyi TaxID=1899563 RepID=A0A1H6FG38_9GAMM|nr:glycine cleavage system protein GcvH [Candidatus Venteria ishoeyi]MDM8546139.1 glycine cleavage system protein GcvH [Candidatus Venteria ishoeyi]SEH08005.1 Glycine cleavage system H protein [Candidatus Venteria ishoeyi]
MSNVPESLKYMKSHEWLRDEGDGTVTIGITEHAQELLGDLVYVDLPDNGDELEAGGECAVLESVKAASDVYSPVNGTITAVNETLVDAPETINESPYEAGWICRIQLSNTGQLDGLLDAAGYLQILEDEDH